MDLREADQPLLTEEERQALGEAASAGLFEQDGVGRADAEVKRHDLASEDSALGVNVGAIDMINERFIRLFRLGMLETLRTSPKINPMPARILRFGDYLRDRKPPLSVNTIRANPLRGNSMIVIEPALIFSALDHFFGGFGRGGGALQSGRMFTPTETRIINMMIEIIFHSLTEAWAPLTQLAFEHVASEINPQFAQIADEDDLVVWTRFDNESGAGSWDLIYPYASLKPLRELLRGRVQTGDGDEHSDAQWRAQLNETFQDAPVEMQVLIGKASITLEQLNDMKVGDTICFERFDFARVLVAGIAGFHANVGELGGQMAVRIERASNPGD